MTYRKLGRTSSHRWAMLRNMVTSLIEHERIRTTTPKVRAAWGCVGLSVLSAPRPEGPTGRPRPSFSMTADSQQVRRLPIAHKSQPTTTIHQAKELRRVADRMITWAKVRAAAPFCPVVHSPSSGVLSSGRSPVVVRSTDGCFPPASASRPISLLAPPFPHHRPHMTTLAVTINPNPSTHTPHTKCRRARSTRGGRRRRWSGRGSTSRSSSTSWGPAICACVRACVRASECVFFSGGVGACCVCARVIVRCVDGCLVRRRRRARLCVFYTVISLFLFFH